jgi:hypothetical protein
MTDSIPIAYDTDPNYYDLSMPSPPIMEDAEKFLDWMEWQQSLVPECYQGDFWQIYDLEGYQAMISDYITIRTDKERYGESIHSQDRPLIS